MQFLHSELYFPKVISIAFSIRTSYSTQKCTRLMVGMRKLLGAKYVVMMNIFWINLESVLKEILIFH